MPDQSTSVLWKCTCELSPGKGEKIHTRDDMSLLYFGAIAPVVLPTWLPSISVDNPFVDAILKVQFATFAMALIILAITYAIAPRNARRFYKPGNLNAPAEPIKWLGIKAHTN